MGIKIEGDIVLEQAVNVILEEAGDSGCVEYSLIWEAAVFHHGEGMTLAKLTMIQEIKDALEENGSLIFY